MRVPLFVCWDYLDLFSVPPRLRPCYCVQLTSLLRELETYCMVCVATPPMFVYSSGAFGCEENPFSRLLCQTANAKLTLMLYVCFIRAAELDVPDLCLWNRSRALREERRFGVIEGVLIPHFLELKANVMKGVCRGLSVSASSNRQHYFWRSLGQMRLIGKVRKR